MSFSFPTKIPSNIGNYVGAGGVAYAANTLSKGWARQSELALKNNQLRFEREKYFFGQQQQSIKAKRSVHRDYQQGMYSASVRDDLLQQIQSAAPIDTKSFKTEAQATQTPSKFSSITLADKQRNLDNKTYKNEIEINDVSIPYKFQETTNLSASQVFTTFVLLIFFGFIIRIIVNKLVQFLNTQIEITKFIKNYKTEKNKTEKNE